MTTYMAIDKCMFRPAIRSIKYTYTHIYRQMSTQDAYLITTTLS